jgi:hypothetical protein
MEFLIINLNSQNIDCIENTIDCIAKIVEDLRHNSENINFIDNNKGEDILDNLIPKLLEFC